MAKKHTLSPKLPKLKALKCGFCNLFQFRSRRGRTKHAKDCKR